MNWKLIVIGLAIAGGINWYLYEREVPHPPGILVPDELIERMTAVSAPWAGKKKDELTKEDKRQLETVLTTLKATMRQIENGSLHGEQNNVVAINA